MDINQITSVLWDVLRFFAVTILFVLFLIAVFSFGWDAGKYALATYPNLFEKAPHCTVGRG